MIGGFLPFGVAALNTCFANLYSGLWYPVVCSAVAAVIGFVAMLETAQDLALSEASRDQED
jgi:hypothetical protein